MDCIKCNSSQVRVIDTRAKGTRRIYRRRVCMMCGCRWTTVPKVVNLLLDANAKQKLYDHVRDEDGTVPVEAVATEIYDIFQNGRQAKNS